jgi:thiol-disulfide isomerase/thioredoxin
MLLAALGAAALIAAPAPTAAPAGAGERADLAHPHPAAAVAGETRRADHPLDAGTGDPDSGAELIGRPAPPWTFTRWLGEPLDLEALRGKVVLLRWWTTGCHFCAATLPELESLRKSHADEGLVVIGVFHPKPPREVSDAKIRAAAKKLGFSGPIAVDREWTTLERYWLADHPERSWTSVSFLVDREGILRWVHGGGEYHRTDDPAHARCATQYRELEAALTGALAAPARAQVP